MPLAVVGGGASVTTATALAGAHVRVDRHHAVWRATRVLTLRAGVRRASAFAVAGLRTAPYERLPTFSPDSVPLGAAGGGSVLRKHALGHAVRAEAMPKPHKRGWAPSVSLACRRSHRRAAAASIFFLSVELFFLMDLQH